MFTQTTGADVARDLCLLLPDHLGFTAPLVPLVAVAATAPNVKVGYLVLNASFYRPPPLARDLASVDSATHGRLIISLGTGYFQAEFDAAGIRSPAGSTCQDRRGTHRRASAPVIASADLTWQAIPTTALLPPPRQL
jgi:alkanesulfonate monooxygenase SsuD/methylene tetrahydromethanopterin reductase-like flavin-dependent oxidoreductase (luciferase family)